METKKKNKPARISLKRFEEKLKEFLVQKKKSQM